MALIPRKPFQNTEEFFGEDDWLLPVCSKKESIPSMDVYETDNSIIIEVSAPGMNSEDLSVSVKGNFLRARGSRKKEKENDDKGYYRKEIKRGSFERVVRLPTNIKEDDVEATYEEGVLKIEIPKREEGIDEGREIKIKSK